MPATNGMTCWCPHTALQNIMSHKSTTVLWPNKGATTQRTDLFPPQCACCVVWWHPWCCYYYLTVQLCGKAVVPCEADGVHSGALKACLAPVCTVVLWRLALHWCAQWCSEGLHCTGVHSGALKACTAPVCTVVLWRLALHRCAQWCSEGLHCTLHLSSISLPALRNSEEFGFCML
jgi:hypothetical protein